MVCWTRAASVPGKSHPPASAPSAKREQHTTAQFRPGCPPGREKPLTCWVWATPALQFLPQAACKQGSALARHEQHTLKSSWARGPSYTAWMWVEDEHLDMGTGGRWQLPPATSTLQCRMEPPRGPRLLGTEQCWLQAGSASLPSLTGGRSIHHQRHNGSPPTATGFESYMCLGNPDIPLIQQKKEEEKKKSPGALQCSFCGSHIQFSCVHSLAAGERCYSGLQLVSLPQQPNATKSTKADMKESFQRKQTNPVSSDKRLQ